MRDLSENGWERVKWISLILFIIATFAFVVFLTRWDVTSSQHVWCQVIDTLNKAPAPAGAAATNPSRAYEQELAREFFILKGQLGC